MIVPSAALPGTHNLILFGAPGLESILKQTPHAGRDPDRAPYRRGSCPGQGGATRPLVQRPAQGGGAVEDDPRPRAIRRSHPTRW